jgi:DNA/RNA endonuclease YhcR with UshA esterase domain
MDRIVGFSHCIAFLILFQTGSAATCNAQTATVIRANLATVHVDEYATVEGGVAKVFTSKSDNTFLNIGAVYPDQPSTGWIPSASPVKKSPILSGIKGKHLKITGRIEMYKGKPEIRINAVEQLEVE